MIPACNVVWQSLTQLSGMQSPALPLIWVAALNATLLPLISFAADTQGFCKSFSKPEVALLLVYGGFCVSCGLAGPNWFDVIDLYHFYSMPFEFWWKVKIAGISFVVCYVLVLQGLRQAWDTYGKGAW